MSTVRNISVFNLNLEQWCTLGLLEETETIACIKIYDNDIIMGTGSCLSTDLEGLQCIVFKLENRKTL